MFGKQIPKFRIVETKDKGRVCVAEQPLPPNTILLTEPSIATVLYPSSRTSFCAYCTDHLPDKGFSFCEECRRTFYCSEECKNADKIFHKYECRAYCNAPVEFLSDADSVHLMRLISVFIHNEQLQNRLYSDSFPTVKPFDSLTPLQLLFDLVGHNKDLEEEYILSQTPVVEIALSFLSDKEMLLMLENIVKFGIHQQLCQICGQKKNINPQTGRHSCLTKDSTKTNVCCRSSEAIAKEIEQLYRMWEMHKEGKLESLDDARSVDDTIPIPSNYPRIFLKSLLLPILIQSQSISDCNAHTIFRDVGFGLFHTGSMFNHSCCPNAGFCHTQRGQIVIATIRWVRSGEEVCVDYSELGMCVERRQGELRGTYAFVCGCGRCVRSVVKKYGEGVRGGQGWGKMMRQWWGRKALMDKEIEERQKRRKEANEKEVDESTEEKREKVDYCADSSGAKNEDDTKWEEMFGSLDNQGGFAGSVGYLMGELELNEIESNLSSASLPFGSTGGSLTMGGGEMPPGPDFGEEIVEEVEQEINQQRQDELLEQKRMKIKQEKDATEASVCEAKSEEKESEKGKQEIEHDLKNDEDKKIDANNNDDTDIDEHPLTRIDREIRLSKISQQLTNPAEWDDVLSCFCCFECGAPMRTVGRADVVAELEKRKLLMENGEGCTDKSVEDANDEQKKTITEESNNLTSASTSPTASTENEKGKIGAHSNAKNSSLNRILERLEEMRRIEELKDETEKLKKYNLREDEIEFEKLMAAFMEQIDGNDDEEDEDEEEEEDSETNKRKLLKKAALTPFSSSYLDHHLIFICRNCPASHRIIAGNRAMLLEKRAGEAFSHANDIEVDCDNLGKGMGFAFFHRSMLELNTTVQLWRRVLHPFHETVIEAMYASLILLYSAFTSAKLWGNDFKDKKETGKKKGQRGKKGKKGEHYFEKTPLPIRGKSAELAGVVADDSSSSDDDAQNKEQTQFSPEQLAKILSTDEKELFLSPLYYPSVILSICRYVYRVVGLLYYRGYPRRALDIKMCGLIALLSCDDAPESDALWQVVQKKKKRSREERMKKEIAKREKEKASMLTKQKKAEKEQIKKKKAGSTESDKDNEQKGEAEMTEEGIDERVASMLDSLTGAASEWTGLSAETMFTEERVLREYHPVYFSAMSMLAQAAEEGELCFGAEHWEIRECRSLMDGGWRRMMTWPRRETIAKRLHAMEEEMKKKMRLEAKKKSGMVVDLVENDDNDGDKGSTEEDGGTGEEDEVRRISSTTRHRKDEKKRRNKREKERGGLLNEATGKIAKARKTKTKISDEEIKNPPKKESNDSKEIDRKEEKLSKNVDSVFSKNDKDDKSEEDEDEDDDGSEEEEEEEEDSEGDDDDDDDDEEDEDEEETEEDEGEEEKKE